MNKYNYTAFDDIEHYNGESQDDYAAFYTPEKLVEKMCEGVKHYSGKTFFDPTFGEGAILAYALKRKLEEGEALDAALTEIYGVELDAPWKGDKRKSKVFLGGNKQTHWTGLDLTGDIDNSTAFARGVRRFVRFAKDNGASESSIQTMLGHFVAHDILTFDGEFYENKK